MAKIIFYVPISRQDTLCCITCDVDPEEIEDSTAISFFHWQTLKCRYLINLMAENVIGSPVAGTDRSFYVIMTKDFYKNSALSLILKRLNLTVSEPLEVTASIYNSCIKYTFDFMLAPKWNIVFKRLYVKDRDFLNNTNINAAIEMNMNLVSNINSTNDEIIVKLMPFNIKLYPLKLQDLGLPQSIINDFMKNPLGVININSFKTLRVSVLPRMTKGKLMSVYKKIPDTCPFATWTDLRRHWKNMYGYRLPEVDDNIIYYEIYFPIAGSCSSKYLIYPDICVREEWTKLAYNSDPAHIASNFMNDLIESMPEMCSCTLQANRESLKNTFNINPMENAQMTSIASSSVTKESEKNNELTLHTDKNFKINESNRQSTTLMSPTPSLKGCKKNIDQTKTNFNFENLKKIKKIHESKPSINYQIFEKYQKSSVENSKSPEKSTTLFPCKKFKAFESQAPKNIFETLASLHTKP